MNTAEYALGTVAACGFACVLLQLLTGWRSMLVQIFAKIFELKFGFPWLERPL